MAGEVSVFRPGDVSYLRIPADDPAHLARFYSSAFGWRIGGSDDTRKFEDASGHLVGHFVSDQAVTGADGVRPYIYVDSVEETLAKMIRHGAEVVAEPYPEGNLTVATVRDPAGNVVGIWQRT
jgi:predicted enzyme related to lactoylglutathione lyase